MEANEGMRRMSGMENLFDKYPRDLLQRFMAGGNRPKEEQDDDEDEATEEIELNLGLSLGGRFGVDKNLNKLIRSTSVASSIPLIWEDDDARHRPPVLYPTLIRTSSLPTETEEECRKRKELQTLRRMEAKRRRLEKQKSSNPLNTEKEAGGGGRTEEERREIDGSIGLNFSEKQYMMAATASNRFGASVVPPPLRLSSWAAAAARQALLGGGIDSTAKGKGVFLGGGVGFQGFGQPNSQGSVESQGGNSSGISDFESKPVQGSSSGGETRSPTSNHSPQERSNQETMDSPGTKASDNTCRPLGSVENPSKRPDITESRGRETGTSAMGDMPCVFTIGDGPNGRRIDGILYKYGKGEEVRIMCVCHGSFLSPAEFVKHAGGGDVAHPLRHIVINPSANSFL